MNPLLEQRREIARRIEHSLAGHPNVTAIFVFGSVATGNVDERSDVDIGIVCDPVAISPPERQELLSGVGTDWTIPYSSDGNPSRDIWEAYDRGTVDGILTEVHYVLASKVSKVLEHVVDEGAITTQEVPFQPYRIGSLVQRAWVLRDEHGVFERWREQTAVYPKLLKQNILRHNVPILKDAVDELTRSAERRIGPGIILFFLLHGKHALDSIAFALNDMYDPADRWEEKTVLPGLVNVPRDFMGRYNHILEGPFDEDGAIERVREFEQLANDGMAISETDLGEV